MGDIGILAAAAMLGFTYGERPLAPSIPKDGRIHTTTPEPLTKRQRRRIRGKS